MKKSNVFIILIFACLTFVSCEKIILEKDIEDTPENNFNYLWNKINMGYAFFDIKNVNWDTIYYEYYPKINNSMSDEELFDVMTDMINELKDGHVNIFSPFRKSFYDISSLGKNNINFRIIKDNYLKNNLIVTGPFSHGFIDSTNIGYIRYSSFSNIIYDTEIDYIFNKYSKAKGIIIDIRQNGGGSISNVFTILSRIIDKKALVYKTQIKTAYGINEESNFSNLEDAYVSPSENVKYTGNVIVLTDRGSYSASSFFALSCKAIPNITLIGDTTGGGLGLPNGGQLPNGWTYRFSITRTLSVTGENWENGIPPDIYVTLATDYSSTGVDDILEKAIEVINED